MRSRAVLFGVVAGLVLSGSVTRGQALTNEGFEAGGLAGWTAFGTGWRTSSFSNELGSDAHSGELGLVTDIKKGVKDEWRGVFQTVPAERNALYTGSVWIRALNARSADAMLEFQFLDKDNQILGVEQSLTISGSEPYTRVEITAVQPPKHTEWLSVRGVVHITAPTGRDDQFILFDDFELSVTNKSSRAKLNGGRSSTSVEERIAKRAADRASGF